MTREEAIKGLTSLVEVRRKYVCMQTMKDEIECLDMAIKALEQQPTTKNDLGVREFEGIDVTYPPEELCTYPEYRGKPYFGIKYKENGEEIVGYGTYNPEVLSQYLKDYFILTTKNDLDQLDVLEVVPSSVLDKIRAEIEALTKTYPFVNHIDTYVKEDDVKKIIDKYKANMEQYAAEEKECGTEECLYVIFPECRYCTHHTLRCMPEDQVCGKCVKSDEGALPSEYQQKGGI